MVESPASEKPSFQRKLSQTAKLDSWKDFTVGKNKRSLLEFAPVNDSKDSIKQGPLILQKSALALEKH